MLDYKKLFKSRRTRVKILKVLQFVPDRPMLKIQYFLKTGRRLNLFNPKRFTEKLQWYKLYYRNPIMKKCVNKYTARKYVEEKGLKDILVPLYAHYKWVEDVEWDKLPESFVIKTQHGGGGLNVIVIPDKSKVSRENIVKKLHYSVEKLGTTSSGREWAYGGIETGTIVEQLLMDEEKPNTSVYDYKFYCFSGKPKIIHVDIDRYSAHKRNFYNLQWEQLPLESEYPNYKGVIERPAHLEEMIRVAERLASDFPFVRVDLYDVGGKVYFGELTFYPSSGYAPHNPDEWDFILGEAFELRRYS